MIQNMRRGIQGRRVRASVDSTRVEPLGPETTELRVIVPAADLTVVGEDRQDASFALTVFSNGADDADAKRLATLAALKIDRAGSGLVVKIDFPREGMQQAKLVAHVPKRLVVRIEPKGDRLDVSNVAGIVSRGNRGPTTLANIAGEADVTQRGGPLRLTHAASLRLNLINGNAEIADILGVASIDGTGGKLQLSGIVGPLDLKSRNTDVELGDAPALKAPLRLDMQAGELTVEGLRTEARIDGRNTDIRVAMEKAAPLTIYNSGGTIVFTPPAGGYTLDAVATDGGFTSEDAAVTPTGEDRDRRFSGPVHGGGPTLTLRATRGRIELRKGAGAAATRK
jgi:hypothetical protein